MDRGDTHETQGLTREQGLLREIDTQRTASDKRASDLSDRVLAELARKDKEADGLRQRIDAVEQEQTRIRNLWDHWAGLARSWWRIAISLQHELRNAHQTINMMREAKGEPRIDWPNNKLPDLEEAE